LLLNHYWFKKENFLRLECTFWGQKVVFKDLAPCSGFWLLALGCQLLGLGSGLFLIRLRRREYEPVPVKPEVRLGLWVLLND